MVSKPVVQDVGDRPDEDVEDKFEEADEGSKEEANGDFVGAGAISLRDNLPEDNNCDGGDDDCHVARDNLVQEDRQSFQWEWVWEEEGREQHVMIVEDLQNGLGYFPFVLVVRVQPDLHLRLAYWHEPHRQSWADPRETGQGERYERVYVEEGRGSWDQRLFNNFFLQGVAHQDCCQHQP